MLSRVAIAIAWSSRLSGHTSRMIWATCALLYVLAGGAGCVVAGAVVTVGLVGGFVVVGAAFGCVVVGGLVVVVGGLVVGVAGAELSPLHAPATRAAPTMAIMMLRPTTAGV